jgi:hypothetical protein
MVLKRHHVSIIPRPSQVRVFFIVDPLSENICVVMIDLIDGHAHNLRSHAPCHACCLMLDRRSTYTPETPVGSPDIVDTSIGQQDLTPRTSPVLHACAFVGALCFLHSEIPGIAYAIARDWS